MCLSHTRNINHHLQSRQTLPPVVFSHDLGNQSNWNIVNGVDLRGVNESPTIFGRTNNDDITSQHLFANYLRDYHEYHLPTNATPTLMEFEGNQPEDESSLVITTGRDQVDYLDLKLLIELKARYSNIRTFVELKLTHVMELLISNLSGLIMPDNTGNPQAINRTRFLNQRDIPYESEEVQSNIAQGTSRNIIHRRRSEPVGGIILSKQDSYTAYERIIIVLNQTKLANFLLLISYIGLLIKSISYESLARHWAQLLTLNLQNFQSRVMNVGFQEYEIASTSASVPATTVGHSLPMPSSYDLLARPNDDGATSWPWPSYSTNSQPENGTAMAGVGRETGATTDICYYLLIVTLMDFLNNLHWYHSERTIKPNYLGREASEPMRRLQRRYSREDTRLPLFRLERVSWLKSAWDLLTSPRHLLQASYVGLIMVMGPLPSTLGALISFHNLLNQIVRHGFNLYRVIGYINLLATWDAHNLYDRGYSPGYYEIDSNVGNNLPRVRGWSYWPVSLEDDGINFKSTSHFYKTLERFLMLSQILGVKVTIFTLLIHLDSLNSCYSFGGLMLFICLVESFLAMHSQYDKYYSRYIHRSSQLKSSEC